MMLRTVEIGFENHVEEIITCAAVISFGVVNGMGLRNFIFFFIVNNYIHGKKICILLPSVHSFL